MIAGGLNKCKLIGFLNFYELCENVTLFVCIVKLGDGYQIGRGIWSDIRCPILYHVMCLSNESTMEDDGCLGYPDGILLSWLAIPTNQP